MWSLLAATTALMGPLVWVLAAVLRSASGHQQEQGSFRQGGTTLPQLSLQNFAFNMYGSLLWQNNTIQANQWSLRILFFVWYIFCYVIYGEAMLYHSGLLQENKCE